MREREFNHMNNKVLIIAEAGVNYNGSVKIAKEMVRAAADAGADIVKFQTGIAEKGISIYAEKADYQKKNTNDEEGEESQIDMARKLNLPFEDYPELIECCKENGIKFLSTSFDIDSAIFLRNLGQRMWKIPSGEIISLPLLRHIGKYGEPVILSTGMSTMEEVRTAYNILKENGADDITLLHCNTQYPTPYEDANIRAMLTLRDEFGCKVGYSDHTLGIEASVAAVALGATVIEKHFTLDRNMEGPDQVASMEPDELKSLVQAIRHVEVALGDGVKKPTKSEIENMNIARRSIVAAREIKKGEVFTEDNIGYKRPGDGMSPMMWDSVIGSKAIKDFAYDEQIVLD